MLAARLAGIRYTVQARASDIHRHRSVFGRRERLMGAALVVTNTRYNEAFLRAVLPAHGAPPLRVIYNGIDLSRFHPAPRRHDAHAGHRILCVGRLVEPKGLEYLLRACTLLRDRGVAFECEIVGGRIAHDINYYLHIKRLWRALGLESVVHFVGALPFEQVLTRHAAADVFVFPAVMAPDGRREVTPNVLIEAMAMQLPVVATTIGAIPEIVEDGVSGLLVPPRDEYALADAISRLLHDPALRETLGANARRRIEERFDIRRNIRAYVELFGGPASAVRS
jgi:glycosyltransferase involved in cell wall biosynthesis